MSHPCSEHALDALLAGELCAEDAERVRAHAEGCAACKHALAWQRLEREWVAQRARREAPALDFAALEARLKRPVAPPPARVAPRRSLLSGREALAMALAAGMAFLVLGVARRTSPLPSTSEEVASWEGESLLFTPARGEVCTDPGNDAVEALEARVGACLLASPALAAR